MNSRLTAVGALTASVMATMLLPSSLRAHHSYAMFNAGETLALTGKVKEFRWVNPHIFVHLVVSDTSGKEVEWAIEGNSPSELTRRGWKRTSLNPGDTATVSIHPLRSGVPGGQLLSVTINGQRIGNPGPDRGP